MDKDRQPAVIETAPAGSVGEMPQQRAALLFMLEDLERSRHQVERAHHEWMAALDVVSDPIFLHDKEFRILRCNKAYQLRAGIPFSEIIGQPYYAVFPKSDSPLTCCLRAMEKAEEEEEEVAAGGAIYRSRAYSVKDEQGIYLYSVHTLEDITAHKRMAAAIIESETRFRNLVETTSDWIWEVDENIVYTYASPKIHDILGYQAAEIIGKTPYDLMPPAEAKRVAELFGQIRAEKKSFTNLENTNLHKDGHRVVLETSGVTVIDPQGKFCGYRGIDRDITARKQSEALLAESEEKFRKITTSAQDAIIMMGADQRISFWNTAAERIFGYKAAETLGQELHPLMAPLAAHAAFTHGFQHFRYSGEGPIIGKVIEVSALRKGGEEFPAELSVSAAQFGGQWHAIGIVRDITEHKRAEQALHESEKLYRSLFENMLNGFAYCRMIFEQEQPQDFIYLNVNAAFETLTGLKNVAGKKVSEVIPGIRQSDPGLFEIYGRVSLTGKPELFEIYVEGLQQWFWISVYSPEKGYFVAVFDVITERKKAEQALIESQRRSQHYLDVAGVMLVSLDMQGRVQMINRKGCEMLGYPEADILGKDWFDNYLPEAVREEVRKVFRRIMGGDIAPVEYFENDILTAGGDVLTVAWHNALLSDEAGKISGVLSSGEDITARKAAEAATQHANRALATLGAVNRSLVYATDENELLQAICQVVVEQHGYRMAWVGYVQHDESKSIKIMARAGHDEGYLDAMQLTWAETERGMGPSGRAIRSGASQLCQDMLNDPSYLLWCAAASQRGYASDIALPLTRESGDVFGILHVYSEEMNAFSPAEIDLLEEMAGDLSFGVRSLRIRQERDRALEQNQQQLVKLHDSMEGTVRAIATIVEMRDPYTAGHQARVADLAVTIAKQMGLPDEQVHAIHLAGTVHDLGKIQIPAEILSKPGRITDIEFSLIKIHPRAGYDILKDINFPWPIAQMVLQHHERLDGSGYPQGLRGDAILLEARILSVADVVEAMSSHRPYRPGLGIEVALEEINRQRGIYFDPAVVDACLGVFRDQHYQLPS